MRILLVEDDHMIGEAVSIALKDAAYAVDWVKDGTTASSVLEHGDHQAVLLDLGFAQTRWTGGPASLAPRRQRCAGHRYHGT